MEDTLCQVFYVLDAVRNLAPQEHTYLILVVGATQDIHDFLGPLATTRIGLDIKLTMPSLVVLVSLCSSQLDATEGSALDVRLHLQNPLDELRIRGTEAHTPTRHIMTLRHRVELDAAVLGTRNLQDGEVFLAEDKAIGVIVDHNDVIRAGKPHDTLIGLHAGTTTRWHIGIVGPEQFDVRSMMYDILQLVKIGLPTIVLAQVIVDNLCTQDL